MGVVNVLLKVSVSCLCGVLSDKYMKDFKSEPIYMQLVQFKCAWFATILVISFLDGHTWQNGFFSGWDGTVCGVLASFTIKAGATQGCQTMFASSYHKEVSCAAVPPNSKHDLQGMEHLLPAGNSGLRPQEHRRGLRRACHLRGPGRAANV